jgi:hypothetical protein
MLSHARLVEPVRPQLRQEGTVTFTFKLERSDGTPADPPMLRTAVPTWGPGDSIPLGKRALRVIDTRIAMPDCELVLIVEDAPS